MNKETEERIKQDALKYIDQNHWWQNSSEHLSYIDGATAEYQRCEADISRLTTNLSQMTDRATSAINMVNALKKERDGLSEEHADLVLALAAMLNGYQNLPELVREKFIVPKDLIDHYTKMVVDYENEPLQEHGEKGGDGG